MKDWVQRLVQATWEYKNTWKNTPSFNPYDLVYWKKDFISIEFEYNTMRMATQLELDVTTKQQEMLL